MPDERLTTVVIGKMHVSSWVGDEFEGRILELLSKRREYEQSDGKGKGKFSWVFADLMVKDADENKIIFARLGKNKKEKVETVFDKERWTYTRVAVAAPKAESFSNFVIIPRSQTILFEEKKPIISIVQFIRMFSSIYNQYFNDISNLKIDLIYEREKIFYKLKDYDKITEVEVSVMPSNPETENDFRQLDEVLKKVRPKKQLLSLKTKKMG